jgi:hypothetical protein
MAGSMLMLGCAFMEITVDWQNPYVIAVTWNCKELRPDPETGELPSQTLGTGITRVKAAVSDENGDPVCDVQSYDWYLDGALFTQGNPISIENSITNPFPIGVHQISLLVKKDSIMSSIQIQFVAVPQ